VSAVFVCRAFVPLGSHKLDSGPGRGSSRFRSLNRLTRQLVQFFGVQPQSFEDIHSGSAFILIRAVDGHGAW
jgi:hypothetical protein